MIKFLYTNEFIHDYKKIKKSYPSLGNYNEDKGDFSDFKRALKTNPTNIGGVERINQLGKSVFLPVYKAKKFACKSLKSTTKLRLIYTYDKCSETIQFIQFIEMYAKADKKNENKDRIKTLLSGKKTLS
ncbi:MAG TPA: hypothetical protein PK674_00765 [Candidatus Absconditabacterales bacterium]|nr:hypothetical protein [Candidatus Absconditabacterales bacterium]HOQ78959.1 hypothetical protein [Candidatus Absconditabacterales bacterium]HPK27763.1 hypothetical protein [Candidatus Absconditabacterales bacterium]